MMLGAAAIGLLAGSVHVLSGPDHLAALAPLAASGERRWAWKLGSRWGLGHAVGVALIGAIVLILHDLLPVERLSSIGERLVGVVLIGIGLLGLMRAFRHRLHVHEHAHGGRAHAHVHVHTAGEPHPHPPAHAHTHAAFAIGVLHGLAGGSHLVGVLPALALSRAAAIGYVAGFASGTILTMAAFTAALGLAASRLAALGARAHRGLLCGLSAAAIAVGVCWLVL